MNKESEEILSKAGITKEELLKTIETAIHDGIYDFFFDMQYHALEPYAVSNAIERGCRKGIEDRGEMK